MWQARDTTMCILRNGFSIAQVLLFSLLDYNHHLLTVVFVSVVFSAFQIILHIAN